MPFTDRYRPAKALLELGEGFSDVVPPAKFPERKLRYRNQRWATGVGLGELTDDEWRDHFASLSPLPGSLQHAHALRYHGHQFQSYNPNLGDGRGFLLAQLIDADGRLLDLGTKGSGTTPYSRGGDGRLTLKGGVREVLATEMLEALGVYTSKTFSLFETGEQLQRSDEPSPTRSSILVRLSHSHVRFGSFQRHAFLRHPDRLVELMEYAVRHYLPEAAEGGGALVERFLRAVSKRSAALAASWIAAGFVHGVLNTDNMVVTGESFDYGPFRFAPTADPNFTAAYFDHRGLYAFGRQPEVVLWNLERLADALSLIAPGVDLSVALDDYAEHFTAAIETKLLERFGLAGDRDEGIVEAFSTFLKGRPIAYEQLFFDWYGGEVSTHRARQSPAKAHYESQAFLPLRRVFESHAPIDEARLEHSYFDRDAPCTLLIDEIETLWDAIADHDDWGPFEDKLAAIDQMRQALVPEG